MIEKDLLDSPFPTLVHRRLERKDPHQPRPHLCRNGIGRLADSGKGRVDVAVQPLVIRLAREPFRTGCRSVHLVSAFEVVLAEGREKVIACM